jgi:hypothetical protein
MTYFPMETSDQYALVIAPAIVIAAASFCVGLRFRAHWIQRTRIYADDWLCFFTLVPKPSLFVS